MPNYAKKAMIGYYAGTMGEVAIPYAAGFKLVDALTGAQVYQGTLIQRPDAGYNYSPTPYQQVYEADFTSFNTPGEYRLVVPGMGGSLPFMIDAGIGMDFARAYALGLYHQRCGTNTAMPILASLIRFAMLRRPACLCPNPRLLSPGRQSPVTRTTQTRPKPPRP